MIMIANKKPRKQKIPQVESKRNQTSIMLIYNLFYALPLISLVVLNLIPFKCNGEKLPQQHSNNFPSLSHQHQKQAPMNIPIPLNSLNKHYNISYAQNRPGSANRSDTFVSDNLEMPTDWLMMGGRDLLPEEGKNVASFVDSSEVRKTSNAKRSTSKRNKGSQNSGRNNTKTVFDDDSAADSSDSNEVLDDAEESLPMAGTSKEPDCASHGRYYCTYKEEYPLKLVTEVTKYYKWPLEKLFRDLHAQIMPKLAQDSTGNLVCDSITRVVRPGWARNTNERWLVVINTENYHQYVTEVVCQYGSNSRCNFIPPCYYSSCQQRYNTQKLLVIDPQNPYRGPFLSEFLFPSCCVCYVPTASDTFQDKYRSSPATIYQRTMQQESANNLYPPQFKPAGLLDDSPSALDHSSVSSTIAASRSVPSSSSPNVPASGSKELASVGTNQASAPGEIRRRGDQYRQVNTEALREQRAGAEMDGFPRLGLSDSLGVNDQQSTNGGAISSINSDGGGGGSVSVSSSSSSGSIQQ